MKVGILGKKRTFYQDSDFAVSGEGGGAAGRAGRICVIIHKSDPS